MIQIVLFFCTISGAPSMCLEKRPFAMEEPHSLAECIAEGEQLAAKYTAGHPEFRLMNIRCVLDPVKQGDA